MIFFPARLKKWFRKSRKRIYLDYAAATPRDDRVSRAMQSVSRSVFGNPSSVHKEGACAKKVLNEARALRVRDQEITFTSGGTESNNLAIFGVVESLISQGYAYHDMHIITSTVEHVSVLKPCAHFANKGVSVTYIPVDDQGRISPESVIKALRPSTILVSLMYVNNEIGTLTSLRKISIAIHTHYNKARKKPRAGYPLVHTDASQAPLFLDCSPERLGVDLLTLDAQKVYGPKGVGLLYRKHSVALAPLLLGGGQEGGLRAGTEALPLIVGCAEALTIAVRERESTHKNVLVLRDLLIRGIEKSIPHVILNGSREERIANNVNITIPDCDMEFLVIKMDHAGVSVSSASACLSEGSGSHVVRALRDGATRNVEALRFTLGKETTRHDIERTINILEHCLKV